MIRPLSFLAVLVFLGLGACTTQRVQPSRDMAAVAPQLSVERFLQAVNARDLNAMADLFGTAEGPMGDRGSSFGCAFKKIGSWLGLSEACRSWEEIELRMDAIAEILEHEDYQIVSEGRVAGRQHPTMRVGVDLVLERERVNDVPFLVVQTTDERWLVTEIGLGQVTGP